MSLIFVQNHKNVLELIPNSLLKKDNYIMYKNQNINEIIKLINKNVTELTFVYTNTKNNLNIPFFLQNIGNYSYFSNDLVNLFKYIKEENGSLKVNLISNYLNNPNFQNTIKSIENEIDINITIDKNVIDIIKDEYIPKEKNILNNSIKEYLPVQINTTKALTIDDLPSKYFKITIMNNIKTCTLLQNILLSDIENWTNSNKFILLHSNHIFDGNNYTITVPWINEGIFESSANSIINIPIIKNLTVTSINHIAEFGGGIVRKEQRFFKVDNCVSNGILRIFSGGICGAFSGQNDGQCIIINSKSYGNNFKFIDEYNNTFSLLDYFNSDYFSYSNIFDINTKNRDIILNTYSTNSNNITDEISLFPLISKFKYFGYGGIAGAFAGQQGNCTIENCVYNGDSYLASGGICGFGSASYYGICDISGCSSNGTIAFLSGGIYGALSGFYSGTLNINNCNSKGDIIGLSGGIGGVLSGMNGYININNSYSLGNINTLSGGITVLDILLKGNLYINNCYSTGDIVEISAGISLIIVSGSAIIENCYSLNNNTTNTDMNGNSGILYFVGSENIIIANCYTVDSLLINTCSKFTNLYVFNSYSNNSLYNINNGGNIYYNSITTKLTDNIPLNLIPITNKLDTSSQVNNLSITVGIINYKVTKWDIAQIWNTPTPNPNDNSIYPTLKGKKYNFYKNVTVYKYTLDKLPSNYFQIVSNENGGFTATLLDDINLNQIPNWKDNATFIVMNNNDIFDGNNKNILVPWESDGIFISYGNSKKNYPFIKNLKINNSSGISFGGGLIKPLQRYFNIDNCHINGNMKDITTDNIYNYIYKNINDSNIGLLSTNIINNNDLDLANDFIKTLLNGGICGYLCGHSKGEIIINNCSYRGLIQNGSGIMAALGGFLFGNCTITKSYTTENINNSWGICCFPGLYNGTVLISNCYLKGNFKNSYLSNGPYLGNLIIENSYASGNFIENSFLIDLRYPLFFKIGLFNNYCYGYSNQEPILDKTSKIYYNSIDPIINLQPTLITLAPIRNQIDKSNQISNIGNIKIGNLLITPTEWDTENIWTIPTSSATDNDIYPELISNL